MDFNAKSWLSNWLNKKRTHTFQFKLTGGIPPLHPHQLPPNQSFPNPLYFSSIVQTQPPWQMWQPDQNNSNYQYQTTRTANPAPCHSYMADKYQREFLQPSNVHAQFMYDSQSCPTSMRDFTPNNGAILERAPHIQNQPTFGSSIIPQSMHDAGDRQYARRYFSQTGLHEHIYCNQEHIRDSGRYFNTYDLHREVDKHLARANIHNNSAIAESRRTGISQVDTHRAESEISLVNGPDEGKLIQCLEFYYLRDDRGLDWDLMTIDELEFFRDGINNMYEQECQELKEQYQKQKLELIRPIGR